ncbi:glycosyltransferase family 25 protein [Arsenophonus endosymbiont of Aleurodicus floccissimus]|uniref:glycosyltransferase family 25 protein n=1 Tax=Arsenophonus endosymbiont of Aleurodicus floccissimus TaxID=2152761 RepID=UPI001601EB60|nr:glycosyltransferase family 25 protein [Arsenophonus endosymbiont of Aleurodicus floccissimus]
MSKSCPIFIVSLKKNTDRRRKISKALSSQALPFTIVGAIEGAKLTQGDMPWFESANSGKFDVKASGMNEITCSLSHQSIYQHIVKNDIECTLILKEDVIIDTKLSTLIKAL